MLEGKIVKGIGGFYYVRTDKGLYTCRARGLFRNEDMSPLIGDCVRIRISDEARSEGYVEEIKERKNQLLRPPVSNIDQAIIVFAVKDPKPNLWLLDKFLIEAEEQNIESVICFNKADLLKEEKLDFFKEIYELAGYRVILTSTEKHRGIDELRDVLKGRTSVFAGPSGVGKSTLLNAVQSNLSLETGAISRKTSRGKHTTRHTELMELELGGFVLDTPGFSSLDLSFLTEDNLQDHFREIRSYGCDCKFRGCRHYKEPGCNVKANVELGNIHQSRYDNYILFLKEIMERRKY